MKRKAISIIVIFSILNMLSCYSRRTYTDINKIKHYDLKKYKSVEVEIKNGKTIKFRDGYMNDEFFFGYTETGLPKKIPLNDIEKIRLTKFSLLSTTITLVFAGALVFFISVIAVVRNMDLD